MTKHPNQNRPDAMDTLRTRKTNKDCSRACLLPVRNAPLRTRLTDSKRSTLRVTKSKTEAETKSASTKHDRKTNEERRPNEGPHEGPHEEREATTIRPVSRCSDVPRLHFVSAERRALLYFVLNWTRGTYEAPV